MAHSVSGHLQVDIAEYDRRIRELVPAYTAMRAVHLDLLAALGRKPVERVLDLGGGTGSLAAAVLEAFPQATVEIWDTDPEMLAAAATRCAPFGARAQRVERSFAEPLPACDAVIACIALHHVKDLALKGRIYSNIYSALRPGGAFLNADTAVGDAPAIREWSFARWSAGMQAHGISDAAARQHFSEWAHEDYYPPLFTELQLLNAAGFQEPECFWRDAPFLIFGGIKPM